MEYDYLDDSLRHHEQQDATVYFSSQEAHINIINESLVYSIRDVQQQPSDPRFPSYNSLLMPD